MTARILAAAAALAVLAGCSSSPSEAPRVIAEAPPAPLDIPPPPMTPVQPAEPDMCGAADLAGLVGRPRSEIPVPVDVGLRRVACNTCPVTADFNPQRLNIFFDADTGLVTEVKCG